MANEIYRSNDVQLRQQIQARLNALSAAISAAVSDDAYNEATWNGVTTIAPSKNAVRDVIETLDGDITALQEADVVHDNRLDDLEAYRPGMMQFDGSTGYYNATFTGAGNKVTLVVRFNIPAFTGGGFMTVAVVPGPTSNYVRAAVYAFSTDFVDADRAGKIQVTSINSSGTIICRLVSATGLLDGENHTLFYSFDGDLPAATFYIDGTNADDAGNADRVAPTAGSLETGACKFGVGADHAGNNKTTGLIGFVGHREAYLTNWSDFMEADGTPKDIDEDGWTEWGAQPLWWNPHGQMHHNYGSADDMTLNGSVTLYMQGVETAWTVPDEELSARIDSLESAIPPIGPSLLLNSQFLAWEYGTPISGTTGTGAYFANRWINKFTDAGSSCSVSQLDTFDGGAKLTFTNTAADYFYVRQYIPSIQQFSGKTYTAVADVETSETDLAYDWYILARYNTDDAERVTVLDSSQVALSATRQQVSVTFTVPTLNPALYTKDNENSLEFAFRIYAATAQTAVEVDIHSITLTQGESTEIPYSSAAYEQPILASFYETIGFVSVVGGLETTSGQKRVFIPWKTKKRIAPTVTYYDGAGNAGRVSTYNLAGTRTDNVTPTAVATDTHGMQIVINSTTVSGIGVRYIANAEWF